MSVQGRRLTPPEANDEPEVRFSIDEDAYSGDDTKLVLERGREHVRFRVDDEDEATVEGASDVPEWCEVAIRRLGLSLNVAV